MRPGIAADAVREVLPRPASFVLLRMCRLSREDALYHVDASARLHIEI